MNADLVASPLRTTDNADRLRGDPRVYFAAERTMLAWVRTGLSLMGFGFVVARFGLFLREAAIGRGVAVVGHPGRASLWVGVILVLLGVGTNAFAAASHARFVRRFHAGLPVVPRHAPLAITLALLLALLGLGTAAYLLGVR